MSAQAPNDLAALRATHQLLWEAIDYLTSDDLWDDFDEDTKSWFHAWRDRYDAAVTAGVATGDSARDALAARFAGVVHPDDDGSYVADRALEVLRGLPVEQRMEAMGMVIAESASWRGNNIWTTPSE